MNTASIMKKTGILALIGVLGFPGTPPSGNAEPVLDDAALTRVLENVRKAHGVPALAGALVTPDGIVMQAVTGERKAGSGVPVTLNDRWHLGSDTKAMTAFLAARLVEEGRLTWETTLGEQFPKKGKAFDEAMREVTLLHLLCHRAGLPANLAWSGFRDRGTVPRQRRLALEEAAARPPLHPIGSTYLYSNTGYVLAGAMLEEGTGQSWESLLRTYLFEPLEMPAAGFGGMGTPGKIDQPWGHTAGAQPVSVYGPAADNPPVLGPAGTVHAPLADWARFLQDQLRGAMGRPAALKPGTYTRLHTPAFGGNYASGWLVMERPWGGGTVLHHAGCNTMHYANAWLAPRRGFAVLACTNQGDQEAFRATDAVISAMIGMWEKSSVPVSSP